MAPPLHFSTCIVHRQFIVAVIDSDTPEQEPFEIPVQRSIAFTVSVLHLPFLRLSQCP